MTEVSKLQLAVAAQAETKLVHQSISASLQELIDNLPFRQRTALMLRIYEDLSFKEIAEIMDCPYDTAKANFRHALLKLKTELEDQDDFKKQQFESEGLIMEMNNRVAEAES